MATPINTTAACSSKLSRLSALDGGDCLGDSRLILNDNFINIAGDLCSLYLVTSALSARPTATVTASSFLVNDSTTVDFSINTNTTNTHIFSASIIDSSLGTIKLGQDITTFGKQLLTSSNVTLSSLSDVQFTSLALNNVIQWDGSKWRNTILTGITGELTDGDKGDITVSNIGTLWQINPDTITNTELALNAVLTENLSYWAVQTDKIADDAVATAKLSANAVTTSKIANFAVSDLKLADNAVTTSKILTSAVTNAKLADMDALTIKGNPTNAAAAPVDITAASNDTVLVRVANALSFGQVPNSATTATSAATTNTIVLRNTSGNFSANQIFASEVSATTFRGDLIGNASTATTAVSALSAGRAVLANRAFTADVSLSALSADRSVFAQIANEAYTAGYALEAELGRKLYLHNVNINGEITGTTTSNFSGSPININTATNSTIITNRSLKSSLSATDLFLIHDTQSNDLRKLTASALQNYTGTSYFRATEVYTNNLTTMSVAYLYGDNTVTAPNTCPTANGTTLAGSGTPTNIWRNFNRIDYPNQTWAEIKKLVNGIVTNPSQIHPVNQPVSQPIPETSKFIQLQPGIYDIEAAAAITGGLQHNVILITFNPLLTNPTFTTIAVGTLLNNDPDAIISGTLSTVSGRFRFSATTGVALIHIYKNTVNDARKILIGGQNYGTIPTWLSALMPYVATAEINIYRVTPDATATFL
jgi:hypothetical protein